MAGFMAGLMAGCSSLPQVNAYTFQEIDQEDSDKDGVINGRDFCPHTPEFQVVNNDGCPLEEHHLKESKYMVLFNNNDSTVDNDARTVLRKVASRLRAKPESQLKISGYASCSGPSNWNYTLSGLRADHVAKALTQKLGGKPSDSEIRACGATHPLVPGRSRKAEAANRRVEILILSDDPEFIRRWSAVDVMEKLEI